MRNKIIASILMTQILVCQLVFGQERGVINIPVKQNNERKQDEVLYRNSYALLIGNSDYSEWNNLPGVERDIPLVEAVLRDRHGFTVEKALNLSKKELLNRIDEFISRYGQNYENRLLIYYAGHGYTAVLPDGRVMGYLVMKDAPVVPPVEESLLKTPKNFSEFRLRAISMDDIEKLAKEISTRHAFFVFDSCFSGTALYRDNVVAVPQEVSTEELEQMRGFLTAGNERQRVRDDSPFRRAFIKGLEGKADANGDGIIFSSELGAFVKTEVYLETRNTALPQSPIFGKQTNFTRGDMIFVAPTGNTTQISSVIKRPEQKSAEEIFWRAIENSVNKNDFEGYLSRVRNGEFTGIYKASAELKLKRIKDAETPSVVSLNSGANSLLSQNSSPLLGMLIRGETEKVIQDANTKLQKNKKDILSLRARSLAYSLNETLKYQSESDAQTIIEVITNPQTFDEYDALCQAKAEVNIGASARLERLRMKVSGSISQLPESIEARKFCTKAITLNADSPLAYINRANAYASERNFQYANIDLNKAIELNPNIYWAYQMRGDNYFEENNITEALKNYTEAIKLKPDFSAAYFSRAKAYHKSKAYDLAVSDYTNFIKFSEQGFQTCVAFKNRALIFDVKGEKGKAAADRKSAADIESLTGYCVGNSF